MTPGVSFIFVSLLFICTAHSAEKGYMAMHSAERLRDDSQRSLMDSMETLLMTWLRDFAMHPSEENKRYEEQLRAPKETKEEKKAKEFTTLLELYFPHQKDSTDTNN